MMRIRKNKANPVTIIVVNRVKSKENRLKNSQNHF